MCDDLHCCGGIKAFTRADEGLNRRAMHSRDEAEPANYIKALTG